MCFNFYMAHIRAKHDFSISVYFGLIIVEHRAQIVHRSLILIIVLLCKHTSNCILYDRKIQE